MGNRNYEIGFGVQPRTYLTNRNDSWLQLPNSLLTGLSDLTRRAWASQAGGSQQGFVGAFSSAYAGHTLLHSRDSPVNPSIGSGARRLSTGFSPDGVINSARIGIGAGPTGAIFGAAAGAAVGGWATRTWRGAATGAAIGAAALAPVGAQNVPGAFHNETGVEHDPRSIALTQQVGPGLHSRFTTMQTDLIQNGQGTYSFGPDLRRTQNCGTSAIGQMQGFVNQSRQHIDMMGQMNFVHQQAGAAPPRPSAVRQAMRNNNGQRIFSANQTAETASLNVLGQHTQALQGIVQNARARGIGNQGHITNYMNQQGAHHGAV